MSAPDSAQKIVSADTIRLMPDSWRELASAQRELAQAAPDLARVLELAAQHAQTLVGGDGVVVELLEGDARAATGCEDPRLRALDARNDAEVAAGPLAALTHERAVVPGIGTRLSVPLIHGRTTLGWLVVSSRRRDAFAGSATELLSAFGDSVAACVAHAQLHEERDCVSREAPIQLTSAEDRRRLLVRNLPGLVVCVYDRDLWIQEVRRGRDTAHPGSDLVGQHLSSVLDPADFDRVEALLRAALRGENQSFTHRGTLGRLWQVDAAPLRSDDGEIEGVLATWRDISAEVTEREARLVVEARLQAFVDYAPDAFIVFDAAGIVTEWNRAAERMFGLARAEALDELLVELVVAPEDRTMHVQRLAAAAAGERVSRRVELTLRHRDGHAIPVEVSYGQITDNGRVLYPSFVRDISGRRAAEAELALAHSNTQAVIDHSPSSIFMRDLNHRFIMVNAEAARVLGRERDDVLGHTLDELWPPDVAERLKGNDAAVVAGGLPQTFEEDLIYAPDGLMRTWMSTKFPVRDARGKIVALGGISHNITLRMQEQAALSAAELRFRLLFERAPIGTCLRGLEGPNAGRLVQVNDALADILGYSVEELTGMDTAAITVSAIDESLEPVQTLLTGEADRVTFEKRYRHRAGHVVTCLVTSTPVTADDGHMISLTQILDISDNKRAEAELREAEERFRTTFEHAPIGVVVVHLDGPNVGRWIRVNPAFATMLGYTEEELLASNPTDYAHPDDMELTRQVIGGLIDGSVDHIEFEKRFVHRDGSVVWARVSTACLPPGPDGKFAIAQMVNVSNQKRLEHDLRSLADHDHLTGLANRRRLQEALEAEIERVARNGGASAVALLDLDGFKRVNDTLGHAAGDSLLASVATALTHELRNSDLVARIGGDEFAILLPEATSQTAALVGTKLLAAIRGVATSEAERGVGKVSASVGITVFDATRETSAKELLSEADVAMYAAKQSGKDQFVIHAAIS